MIGSLSYLNIHSVTISGRIRYNIVGTYWILQQLFVDMDVEWYVDVDIHELHWIVSISGNMVSAIGYYRFSCNMFLKPLLGHLDIDTYCCNCSHPKTEFDILVIIQSLKKPPKITRKIPSEILLPVVSSRATKALTALKTGLFTWRPRSIWTSLE